MHTEASITIDRLVDVVFQLTNNHVADWSITVVEDTVVKCTLDVVGTTFRSVTEDRGKRMEFDGVITEWKPPHLSRVKLTGTGFDIDAKYTFESLGESQTKVTVASDVDPKGFYKVMFVLFGWLGKKADYDAQAKELDSLKAFVEARA